MAEKKKSADAQCVNECTPYATKLATKRTNGAAQQKATMT
jgi:hypothetical protein